MHTQLLDALRWRYAAKQYDTTRKLDTETLETLKEVIRLAPSSVGLQPWKFVIVTDPEVRKQLRAVGYDQAQITDASHLIVFCRRTDLGDNLVAELVEKTAEVRKISVESLEGLQQLAAGSLAYKPGEAVHNWAAQQVYIPLGKLLEAAALLKVDASPMEGFDPAGFDKILGLTEQNLASVVICGLGYRSPDDKYATAAKVRFAAEDIFIQR